MSCPEYESRLHDHADDLLSAAERREVETHLGACAACRQELEDLASLRRRIGDLPRSIAPRRDLLPAIRAAVGVLPRESSANAGWTRWAGLAAALALGALLVVGGVRRAGGPTIPVDPGPGGARPASAERAKALLAAEHEYSRALEQLMASFEERRDELSPAAAEALTRNLAIIDRAIDDIRTALEVDPDNPANTKLLAAMHHQKVELLWRVLRLSS